MIYLPKPFSLLVIFENYPVDKQLPYWSLLYFDLLYEKSIFLQDLLIIFYDSTGPNLFQVCNA